MEKELEAKVSNWVRESGLLLCCFCCVVFCAFFFQFLFSYRRSSSLVRRGIILSIRERYGMIDSHGEEVAVTKMEKRCRKGSSDNTSITNNQTCFSQHQRLQRPHSWFDRVHRLKMIIGWLLFLLYFDFVLPLLSLLCSHAEVRLCLKSTAPQHANKAKRAGRNVVY